MASDCSKKNSMPCYCYDKKYEDYLDLKAAGFPIGYDYRVCNYASHGDGKFEVKLRVHMATKGEMLLWIENFKKSSAVPFINSKTHPCSEDPIPGHSIYKADWKCHLNTNRNHSNSSDPNGRSKKCRSIMHTSLRKARLMTPHESRFDHHEIEGFMGVVSLRHYHNHPLFPITKLHGLNPSEELTISLIKPPSKKVEPSVVAGSSTNQLPSSICAVDNSTATSDKGSSHSIVETVSRSKSQNEPGTDDQKGEQCYELAQDAGCTAFAKRKRYIPSSAVIPKKALKTMPSTGLMFELVSSQIGDVRVITQNKIMNKSPTVLGSTKRPRKSEHQKESYRMKILYVASSTRDYIAGLFSLGFVPPTAHVELREDLKTNYGEDFEKIIKDRGFYPNLVTCQQLFVEFKMKNGSVKESDHHSILEKLVNDYNNDACIKKAKFEVVGDNNYAVAVLSPFMRQISRLWPRAKDEVLLTRCGTLQDDPKNCLFLFLTPSPVGALPVGAFITSSLLPKVISKGVELYHGLLDKSCFGGNGTEGPRVIITDDSLLLIRLMNSTFPRSSVFLADKFVVDSSWKWVWGSDSPVPKESRPRLMMALEDVFRSRSSVEMEMKLAAFFSDKSLEGCEGFDNFCDMLKSKKQHFAISYGTVVDGCKEHTTYESFFSVINDMVMQNSKLSTITTMTHFAMVRLSAHFYRKMTDALNWKTGLFKRNYYPRTPRFRQVTPEMVTKLSKSEFIVKSFSTDGVEYHCNVELGRCCCYVGWRGCPCKHLGAVAEFYPDYTCDNYHPALNQQDMVSFYNCLMDPVASTSPASQGQNPANSPSSQSVSDEVGMFLKTFGFQNSIPESAEDILAASLSVHEEKDIEILPN